jgi:hypothetical protein
MFTFLMLVGCAKAPLPPAQPLQLAGEEGLRAEAVGDGPLSSRVGAGDGADLILLFGGERKGELGPCGCPNRPMGGLPRFGSLRDAVAAASPTTPLLVLDTGYFLEDAASLGGELRADVPLINRWMAKGMVALAPDAINVAYNDMPGLRDLGADPGLPLVSANISGDGVEPWRILTVATDDGPVIVGITGISAPGPAYIPTPGFVVRDPVKAGREVLAALGPQVELVILMAYGATDAARTLSRDREVGDIIDLVLDANLHTGLYPPVTSGRSIWSRSPFQGRRGAELRLGLVAGDNDRSSVSWATDRRIDLDDEVADLPALGAIADAAAPEIEAATAAVFAP